jgi:protein-S-isoprenylcysteine O-methyltransferase Ste14
MPTTPWWKNSRGELFVLGQSVLFAMLIFGPRTLATFPDWSNAWQRFGQVTGALLMATGTVMAFAGTAKLGRNLTPFICPKANAVLLEQGAYRLVRHPIYSGILQLAFGWGLWVNGWLTLGYALLLGILFERKSRREEEYLRRTFPGYSVYSSRVKRLLPFVY